MARVRAIQVNRRVGALMRVRAWPDWSPRFEE